MNPPDGVVRYTPGPEAFIGAQAELEAGPAFFVASEHYVELGPSENGILARYPSIIDNLQESGWVPENTRSVRAEIGFADAYDPEVASKLNLPRALTRLSPNVARNIIPADISGMYLELKFPIVATTTMMGSRTRLTLGPETLDIEAFSTERELDRLWVEKVMKQGPLEVVPLGIGFANGPGAAIDASSFLIRVAWSDGTPLVTRFSADRSRVTAAMARARELMKLIR